ncbi:MAG: WYL domain-containing protein [Acidimicrobiales bacterium]
MSKTGRRGPRPTPERLRRLLVVLPWLMAHGRARVDDVAERFGVSPDDLVRDLELAALCGLPPYTDELVDLYIEDGWVEVGIPRLFTRPRRFTPDEGFALLAAGRGALALPGADTNGPLASALDKLEQALGITAGLAVDVDQPPLLAAVRQAAAEHESLAVSYWSAWRDERTERVIDPLVVFTSGGRWYVVADDSLSGPERVFRVDRIEEAKPTSQHFAGRDVAAPATVGVTRSADTVTATVVLPESARWVVEAYPVESVDDTDDGRLRVTMVASGERWLERVLLRAGAGAEVLDPLEWVDLGSAAARRLLALYR